MSRQHRSRQPPGKIAVMDPEQTGAQPNIRRTSQNFTHPGTGGPLSGQSTLHSLGNFGPALPSGQLEEILTMGTAVGRSVSGVLVGNFLGGATGTFVGLDMGTFVGESAGCMVKSTGDVVGGSVGEEGTPVGRLVGDFFGRTTGAFSGFDVTLVGDFTGRDFGNFTGCFVIATGEIVGILVGTDEFGSLVWIICGLDVLSGTIAGTGRSKGFSVGVGACGDGVDFGFIDETSLSLVIFSVNVPTSVN